MIADWIELDSLLYRVIALLIAIVLHDAVQAAAARLLGDRTAKEEGRLTLSPIPHTSAWGVVACLFGPFGWSKPVPVRPDRLRGGRLSAAAVFLSGMLINLALGIVCWWIFFTVPFSAMGSSMPGWIPELLHGIVKWTYILNVMFFLLQLLPFYPMDSWKMLKLLFPKRWEPVVLKYEKLGTAVLLGLVATPFGQLLLNRWFEALTGIVMNLYSLA